MDELYFCIVVEIAHFKSSAAVKKFICCTCVFLKCFTVPLVLGRRIRP